MFRKKTDPRKVALGAGIAAAVGYVVGILTAPQSGKKTRRDIQKTAKKGVNEAEKEVQKLHDELTSLTKDAKKKGGKELTDLVKKAKTAKDKTTTLATAVKNGEAKDEELQKALTQAKNAVNNVRKYLKK